MSRRRKALINAAFAYAQSGLGILASFWITRLLVRVLGTDQYGAWLATGGLIAYAGMTDLGIFAVMPWLFAEADGAKDLPKTRSLVTHGLLAGMVAGIAYLVAAYVLWWLLPHMAHLDSRQLARIRGPLAVMVLATAIGSPLQLFTTFLYGRQDFKFLGSWQLVGTVLNATLTYGLLRAGAGLYAVAIATVAPSVLVSTAALTRTLLRHSESLRPSPRPSWRGARSLIASGSSSWMGRLGWQLAAATDALVLANLGHTRLIPSFIITSRLGLTLMQLAWSLPDSALIGLANLGAEGDRARTAEAVRTLIRVTLVPLGAVACVTLAANGALVRAWVGGDLYGGMWLNALFTLGVVALSVVHAILTPCAVLGSRWQVGSSTLANGVVHIIFALVLGRWFGLAGVAAATTLSALVTTVPVGVRVLAKRTGISAASTVQSLVLPWALRALPCCVLAALAGSVLTRAGSATGTRFGDLIVAGAGAATIVMVYMWSVRGMMANLPFGPRLTRILSAIRLL
jgi:O-antigen/teichoic acid export membrane protein